MSVVKRSNDEREGFLVTRLNFKLVGDLMHVLVILKIDENAIKMKALFSVQHLSIISPLDLFCQHSWASNSKSHQVNKPM